MQTQAISLVVLSDTPLESAQFYIQHFGFKPTAELPWFVSLQHPDHSGLFFDLLNKDHAAAGRHLQGKNTSGVMLALVVGDLDAEAKRLRDAGLTFLMDPTDEPWGQRRLQIQAPDGVIVEVLQQIPPDQEWLRQNGLG